MSPYHKDMKFSTPNEIGVVWGNKKIAQECYLTKTKDLGEAILLTSSFNIRMDKNENERMNL